MLTTRTAGHTWMTVVTQDGDIAGRADPARQRVLRGEMSLVGPPPLVPDEDSNVEGFYRRRLDISPGITGYRQAPGRSRCSRWCGSTTFMWRPGRYGTM